MANVSFGGVELSSLGFSLQGLNGRAMAPFLAEKSAALFRNIAIDINSRHSLDTKTDLSGTLSANQDDRPNFNRANFNLALVALKDALDPEEKGYQKLIVTGDGETKYRWCRFEGMSLDERRPIFKLPFQPVGLTFENLEPYWRVPATQLLKTAAAFSIPNGAQPTRPSIQLTVSTNIVTSVEVTLLTIGDLTISWQGVDLLAGDLLRIDCEEGVIRRVPLITPAAGGKIILKNLMLNPSAEVNATDGGMTVVGATLARATAQFNAGIASFQLTSTGTATLKLYNATRFDVVVGKSYAGAIQCRPESTVRSYRAVINWHNSAGGLISSTLGTTLAGSAGAWVRPTVVGTAPEGAVTAALEAQVLTPANTEIHYADSFIAVLDTLAPSYFDGSTSRARWLGVAHNSASELVDYEEDVIRAYRYSGSDDPLPLIPKAGSAVTFLHPSISQIQIDYDLLTK